MFDALAMLVLLGQVDRTEVAPFLRDCFTELRPQGGCLVWYGWQSAIAALELRELAPLVKRVFDRDFVPIEWMTYEEFEEDMDGRSEEHTSELQSLMRISYAVFCLKKNTHTNDYK